MKSGSCMHKFLGNTSSRRHSLPTKESLQVMTFITYPYM